MSDTRHCDGPECEQSAQLTEEMVSVVGRQRAEQYIILTRPSGFADLHFHNDACLTKWTGANAR